MGRLSALRLRIPGAYEFLDETNLPPKSCLLIDYHMPVMNGLELLARLRDRGISAPAMVITSQPTHRLRERIAAAGVPLVEKPFLGKLLVDQIRDAFRTLCPVGLASNGSTGAGVAH